MKSPLLVLNRTLNTSGMPPLAAEASVDSSAFGCCFLAVFGLAPSFGDSAFLAVSGAGVAAGGGAGCSSFLGSGVSCLAVSGCFEHPAKKQTNTASEAAPHVFQFRFRFMAVCHSNATGSKRPEQTGVTGVSPVILKLRKQAELFAI